MGTKDQIKAWDHHGLFSIKFLIAIILHLFSSFPVYPKRLKSAKAIKLRFQVIYGIFRLFYYFSLKNLHVLTLTSAHP